MIARALRLRKSFDFERVRRNGRAWTTRLAVVIVLPNGRDHNRYGFAVGRRVGNAARRNRVKRWLKEAVRHQHPKIRPGHDILFVARGAVADDEVAFDDMRGAVDHLLHRARLFSNEPLTSGTSPDST